MWLWNNLWSILFFLSLPASVSNFFMQSRVISFNLFLPFSDIYWNKNESINVWRCLGIVLTINFVFCLKTVYFLWLFCLTRSYRVLDWENDELSELNWIGILNFWKQELYLRLGSNVTCSIDISLNSSY